VYALGYAAAVSIESELATQHAPRARDPWRPPFGLPRAWQALQRELDARIARIPTRLNEYGYDAFGLEPALSRWLALPMLWI
jgi:hypothetical protein